MNFQHVQVRLRIASKWYQALAVLFFLMVTYVILGLASPGLADTDLGVVDTGVKWPVLLAEGAIYIAILFRLFLRPKHYLRAAAKFTTILPLIAICFLSSLWSSDPYLTVRRAAALLLSSIVALIIGADFELKQIIRFFSAATVIHMLLVAVFFVVSPHTLYSPSDPVSLKGLTTHKNVFGHEMALGFLALALVPFRRWAMLRWPLAFACFGLLLLAHSTGALVSLLGALIFLLLLTFVRFRGMDRYAVLLVYAVAAVSLGALLYAFSAHLPGLFGKNDTLTGRTELWALVRVAIGMRPLLGYGFDTFWMGYRGVSSNIQMQVGWLVPTAHNGYYDLMLGVGFLGALSFVPAFWQMLARCWRFLNVERSSARYYPLTFVAFWLIYNLNESLFVARSGIPYLLFVCMSVSIAMHTPRLTKTPRRAPATFASPEETSPSLQTVPGQ